MKTCAGSITFTLMACRQESLNCTKGGQRHATLAENKSYNALLNAELLLFWRTLLADEKGTRAISTPLQLAASFFLIPRANLVLFDSISHSPGPPCLLVMWLCIWPILFFFFSHSKHKDLPVHFHKCPFHTSLCMRECEWNINNGIWNTGYQFWAEGFCRWLANPALGIINN